MSKYLFSGFTWASVAGLIAIALLNSWASRINQFFFFSRTTPPGFGETTEAREITAAYLTRVWLGFGAGLLLFFAALLYSSLSVFACFTFALILQSVFASVGFARAHRATGDALTAGVSIPDTDSAAIQPRDAVSVSLLQPATFSKHLTVLLFLAPAFTAAAWLGSMYAAHVAPHLFMAAMEANKADFLTGMGLGLMTASLLLYVQLRYFSRHRSPMARFTVNGAVQLAWLGAAVTALSALTVPFHLVITTTIHRTLVGVVLALALLRMLYGCARPRMFPPPQVELNGDEFWRWGLFYYNPSDPTLFIQHRAGPGYTVNFANFLSWPLTLAVLADLGFLISLHVHR